jgi:hypothetical protein
MKINTIGIITAKPNSAVASQPCPLGHITADKREIKDFPKSRQVGTSFIRNTMSKMSLTLHFAHRHGG